LPSCGGWGCDIGVVVGYLGHLLREYLGDGSRLGARLRYVEERERLGIAHAIHLAIEAGAVDRPFVAYLGDNILAGIWPSTWRGLEKEAIRGK